MRRIIIAAAGAALALGGMSTLAGCGSGIESVVEDQTGVDIDANEEGLEITDDQGNSFQAGEDVEVPDAWPSDAPLYDGQLVSAVAAGGGVSLVWTSSSSTDEAFDEYSAQLESAGFKVKSDGGVLNQGETLRTSTFESDRTLVIVVAGNPGDGVTMSVTATPKT